MAFGISAELPLTYDPADGPYRLTKTLREAIKQNVKNLFLTNKGERVMMPSFGVGFREFLFENWTAGLASEIESAARTQVKIYLPFVKLNNLTFLTEEESTNISPNMVRVIVNYSIPKFGATDEIILEKIT